MPTVLKGFLIVAILAAAMSSVTAALSALSSVSTMDIFRGFSKKKHSDEFYMKFSRGSMIGWAVVLILVASASTQIESALNTALALSGWTNGAMLGGLILVLFWRKGSAVPVIAGMATAVLATFYIANFVAVDPGQGFKFYPPTMTALLKGLDAMGNPIAPKVAWPWFTLIGTIVTLAVASLIRPFSKTPPQLVDSPESATASR
jgi:solute:Na+ symporter, SSS family